MTTAQDDHPRMPLRKRVPLVAAFALEHVAEGFTDRQRSSPEAWCSAGRVILLLSVMR